MASIFIAAEWPVGERLMFSVVGEDFHERHNELPAMNHSDFGDAIDERIHDGDPYLNYCLWPYEPVTEGNGKLRASSLLFRAIQEMESSDWLYSAIRSIQAGLGDFRSVYGIKYVDGQWALEVYLYDYERQNRVVSIERLMAACGNFLRLPATVGGHLPYFMFSFDLDTTVAAANGKIDLVHVYIGNPGSTVSSGISYGFSDDPLNTQLENFYFFFDASDTEAVTDKICCSAFLDDRDLLLATVLPSELTDCNTICLANKPRSNTVYFSGIAIQQLLFFLKWQDYPIEFAEFVQQRQLQLNHLRFDVGIDYTVVDNKVVILKSGIYGCF